MLEHVLTHLDSLSWWQIALLVLTAGSTLWGWGRALVDYVRAGLWAKDKFVKWRKTPSRIAVLESRLENLLDELGTPRTLHPAWRDDAKPTG